MTNSPSLNAKSSVMLGNFEYCQFIDVEKGIDFEVTKAATVSQRDKENTPTKEMAAAKMLSAKPSRHKRRRTPTGAKQFTPLPPPSAPIIDPSTGAFHPDFMYCGFCTDCKDEEDKVLTSVPSGRGSYNDEIESNSDSDSNSVDSFDNPSSFLQTIFQVNALQEELNSGHSATRRKEQNHHNEMLVLRSLLRAIPGIRKVSIPVNHDTTSSSQFFPRNVVIRHDASVLSGTIRQAFAAAGYSASISESTSTPAQQEAKNPATNNMIKNSQEKFHTPNFGMTRKEETYWVRSSFDVEGICCASEIPAIRKIVKPLMGVAKVNINLTTKIVHVQHNHEEIQASQIAHSLTRQGFPAKIKKDGALTSHFISNVVTGSGDSDDNGTQANTKALADLLDRVGKSPFVESTLTVDGLRSDQVHLIEKAVADAFIRVQVRAVYPSAISETIKVEHNPDLVSIADIRDFLRARATRNGRSPLFPPTAEVYIDGADSNLYLPSINDYPNQPPLDSADGGCISRMKRYHVNVILSGFFWILSMTSIVGGMDEYKYFGLASVFFGLPPILLKAYRTLRRCQFDANCMMVTAALGALALGEYDEAASVSFLFAVSEFLESRASYKARKALSEICALRPDHANVIHPITNEIVVVPADRVPSGSLISVRTGDKIVADGIVTEGSTSIDESSLTGESIPVQKCIGDEVSGGTINIGQTQLVVRTTTTVEDSAVSRLIRLVEEAQSNRSPTEMMVDAFARSYTPSVILIATVMSTVPWYFGSDIGRQWTLKGLIIVVIACPCALTISTPVTYAAGLAATAKRGVIIKGGAKLEAMGSVDHIVFDKTGTLTKGRFSVTQMAVIGDSKSRQEMLQLLSLMQERASHPIASSLVQAVKNEGINVPRQMLITDHQILKGEGITAKINGQLQVYVGNQRLFDRLGMYDALSSSNKNRVEEWEEGGGTTGFIGSAEDGMIGMFCVKDSVREEAKQALAELKEAGIKTYICTGDRKKTAQAVAREIGINDDCIKSELLPEDKLHFVQSLRRAQPKHFPLCRNKEYVLFCGDGVNDAPALAAVDIGVSMGEGAAMALEMSDVTLMDSRLTKLPYAIQMGHRVLRTVKENIVISFLAKFTVVLLTFMGKMTLLFAIASDVGIMLLVTFNGMKLLPNKRFELLSTRLRRRRRAIARQFDGLGKTTDFELVRMDRETGELKSSHDSGALEIA